MIDQEILKQIAKLLAENGFKKIAGEELNQINQKILELAEEGENISKEVNKQFANIIKNEKERFGKGY